ncbi:EpsG family protein [Seohaeicola saemankumensis]|uniref:EpsG family protein n=1 Tax=Seohaeicola saemankumensis TaxID=481181 RepID=A0ABW3TDI4_9RHOB
MLEALFFSNLATVTFGLLMSISRSRLDTFILISLIMVTAQSVIIGLRDPRMMTDTREYAALFTGTSGFEENIEPAFMLFVYLFRLVTDQVDLFLITASALLNLVYFSFLYLILNRYSLLAFGLFGSTFPYWLVHVQILRSGIASAFLLLGISLFLSQKYRRALILLATSVATHFSMAVVSTGAFLGYVASDLSAKKILSASVLIFFVFIAYEYAIPNVTFLAPWKQRLEAYSYYAENVFVDSSFGYQYVFFLLILISLFLFWRRQHETTKILFFIYFTVTVLSFAFWSNVLYRDRIFIFAQLIEPALLTILAISVVGRKYGALLISVVSVLMSILVIFYWGPRTVLIF